MDQREAWRAALAKAVEESLLAVREGRAYDVAGWMTPDESTSDPDELSRIARGLEKIGGPRAIAYFLGEHGLKSASKDDRITAAKALPELAEPGHYGAIKALEARMNDEAEDPVVRRLAKDGWIALIPR